jgi:predicted amidohydrolase
MPEMKIALAQMRCEKGAVEANLAVIAEQIREAVRQGVDIICFPEMSITGYIDPARQPGAVLRLDGPELARFAALTSGAPIAAIAGLVEHNPHGKPFITQVIASGGALRGHYRKRTIVDEEAKWFSPGFEVLALDHPRGRFSLAICADIDEPAVFADGARAGARVVFEAAAPGLYGDMATRNWRSGYEWWRGECHTKLARYARDNRVFIAVATQAGRTADEDFPGGGYVFGPDGALLAETPDWSEQVLYATLPLDDH